MESTVQPQAQMTPEPSVQDRIFGVDLPRLRTIDAAHLSYAASLAKIQATSFLLVLEAFKGRSRFTPGVLDQIEKDLRDCADRYLGINFSMALSDAEEEMRTNGEAS